MTMQHDAHVRLYHWRAAMRRILERAAEGIGESFEALNGTKHFRRAMDHYATMAARQAVSRAFRPIPTGGTFHARGWDLSRDRETVIPRRPTPPQWPRDVWVRTAGIEPPGPRTVTVTHVVERIAAIDLGDLQRVSPERLERLRREAEKQVWRQVLDGRRRPDH